MLEIGPEFGQMELILKENRKHKSLVTEGNVTCVTENSEIIKYGLTTHEVYHPQSVIQHGFICNG